ncbi:MAG: hypothetical protein CMO80_17155 [Verrucomicrobiales bacterium]|nr:hypothetical protein [Verrucomicrobiales bacterium]
MDFIGRPQIELNYRTPHVHLIACLALLAVCRLPAADYTLFENEIRPLFIHHCLQCHSGLDPAGELRLDLKIGWMKGGTRGPAIVPHKPDKSLVVQVVTGEHPELKMPRKGEALSQEKIGHLITWVSDGAPDPRDGSRFEPPLSDPARLKDHWAFQPVARPSLPGVRNGEWVQSPIDTFVLKRLEDLDLAPSKPADRRTLIRRLYINLLGHPPTYAEVQSFVHDEEPNAVEALIDRLLASPQYGERWARHWLDVARYSDTAGYKEVGKNRRYVYSYTYRDYVIEAFNRDLPFDRFVREQIAADKMLHSGEGATAALGFLTLGPVFLGNNDLVIDDRIDVVTRGFMGLSVQCARCHDHKYDPIPTTDYYSLYSVFASSEEPEEKPLLGMQPPQILRNAYLTEQAKRQAAYDDLFAEELENAQHRIRSKLGSYLLAFHERELPAGKSQGTNFFRLRNLNPRIFAQWQNLLTNDLVRPHPVLEPWLELSRVRVGAFAHVAERLRRNPTINPVVRKILNPAPGSLRELARRYDAMARTTDAPRPNANRNVERLRQFLRAEDSPLTAPESEHETLVQLVREKLNETRAHIHALDATHPGAPRRAHVLIDKAKPVRSAVFIRGNNRQRGQRVPRQFLEFIEGRNRKPFTDGSGRLELAEAILGSRNPLTARVFVNRVWLHHFGRALVDTPSDFGVRADPPTHPKLLDWLSDEFVSSGWSVKHLHRLILRSAAWQQSSQTSDASVERDPENRLLSRFERHRLDFESIWDSLLHVSGNLNLRILGQSFDLNRRPAVNRRAVYGFVDRTEMAAILKNFDVATPDTSAPKRFQTTVPQQSLFLMNSAFMVEAAEILVGSLAGTTERERIRQLYQRAFQRDPLAREIRDAEAFLALESHPASSHQRGGWDYGVGSFDPGTAIVEGFQKFPLFADETWKEEKKLPSTNWKYARLTADGGHPGPGLHISTIRRWIAPATGEVSVDGSITHNRRGESDGVQGFVVSSGTVHWQSIVRGSTQPARAGSISVQRGQALDFIVSCRANQNGDLFSWAPRIAYQSVEPGQGGFRRFWDAGGDFGPPTKPPPPPSRWTQLAQVLLVSNEMLFVD